MSVQLSTLHFDLAAFSPERDYRLLCGVPGGVHLRRYADEPAKLDEHRSTNAALGLLSESQLSSVTHFVEAAPLTPRGVQLHRVVFPSLDDHPLPEIAMAFLHVGDDDVREALHRMPGYAARRHHHLALASYQVDREETLAHYDTVHRAAQALKPPGVTAQAIVMQHPEIGTVNGVVAQYVLDTYVSRGIAFQELVAYLQANGPGTESQWYNKSWVKWSENADGTGPLVPMEANTELVYQGGQKITDWPTPAGAAKPGVPTYDLTDEYDPPVGTGSGSGVIGAASAVVSDVLRTTKDDTALQGLLWNSQTGTTERTTTAPASPVPAAASAASTGVRAGRAAFAAGSPASGFAVKNITSSYGLMLYDTEMKWTQETKHLSFPVKNWPARYLGLYVTFHTSDGTVISREKISAANPQDPAKPFTWQDRLPLELVRPFVERSDTKNYLGLASAGSSLFGAPTPFLTQQVELSFLWPDDATRAVVLLGGLGCASGFSDWDRDVDIVGVLGTGIVCYGVGAISMLAQVYVVNPFIEMLQEEWGDVGFYAVCGVIGATGLVTGVGTVDTSFGKSVLSQLAGIASGVVFGAVANRLIMAGAERVAKRLAKATAEYVAEMTAQQILEQVPVAGWALKVVSIAASLASLTATTVECVLSPATYQLDVLRTMDLQVTVRPDPTHGTTRIDPVWPLVSDHYVVRVTYPAAPGQPGGTTYTAAGPMPGALDAPIVVTFEHIPAGGKVEVEAGIYSDNDWLCGRWNSGWISAVPASGHAISCGGAIKEILVPLTPTTSYSQKQMLAYAGGAHVWMVTQFTLESALVPAFNAGGSPSAAIREAFAAKSNPLTDAATISVVTPMKSWKLADATSGASFDVEFVDLSNAVALTLDPATSNPTSQLRVRDTQHGAPPLPEVYPLPSAPTGHEIGALQNIIHNNTSYQLGYAWMASGQNLPLNGGNEPQNGAMYAMQSISSLARPEDFIIEPTRGFSLPSLIAYDQYGLTELFPLPSSMAEELVDGPVPADVSDAFVGFGRSLPNGSIVTVVAAGSGWTIGVRDASPLYQLDLVTTADPEALPKSPPKTHIAVYAYPVPGLDNFYLDPRSHTTENPVFHLRGVDLDAPGSKHTFDYDTTKSWGRFVNAGSLQGLAVHPQGYVVGVDFVNHKLYALKLPAAAVASEDAPYAMPLAGEGVREGLMQNPQALTISSDGRILVLEEGNRRIQAFDIKGNPVGCFSVDQPHFLIGTHFVTTLDAHEEPPALVQAFQAGAAPSLAPKIAVANPGPVVADLDAGVVDSVLVTALDSAGYGAAGANPHAYAVATTTPGRLWLLTDTTSGATFDLRLESDDYGIAHLEIYLAPTLMVTIESAGASWLVEDTTNAARYHITRPATGDLVVQKVVSFMPLREATSTGVTYLDIATEPKGYIYVLMVQQASGAPTFFLDIYQPDGSVLLDKPQSGVNAERLTVDQWRSMFTLGFGVVLGPDGRTEPGVSAWMPSTPTPATSQT